MLSVQRERMRENMGHVDRLSFFQMLDGVGHDRILTRGLSAKMGPDETVCVFCREVSSGKKIATCRCQ